MEQTAHFFDSFFLKVSVDQFLQSRYIPINDPQGGGADISSFSGNKDRCPKEMFLKFRQSRGKRYDIEDLKKEKWYVSPF